MVKHADIDHTGLTGIPAAITELTDIATAEMDDTLRLAPDGAGGVEWVAVGSGLADEGAFTYLDATDGAAPSNPSAGYARIYAKSGRIYSRDSSGTEYGPFDAAGSGSSEPAYETFSPVRGRTVASAAPPAANRAIYIPFVLPTATTAAKLWYVTGSTATGDANIDMGVYATNGSKVVSKGSTAWNKNNTNAFSVLDIADTALAADTLYYLALVVDATSNVTFLRWAGSNVLYGLLQEASAFPLPATATFALPTTDLFVPFVGLTVRSEVA